MSESNAADGTGSAPSPSNHDPNKIDVVLKFVGDTPIMRKTRWAVERQKTVCSLVNFIHKYLKCEGNETIFVYVNQCFAPHPDITMGTLYDCYGSEGKLILNYSKSEAWG